MKVINIILLSMYVLTSNLALANNKNTFNYFGASLQKSNFDEIQFQSNPETVFDDPKKYKESTSGIGVRIFTGFNFNEYIAVEAGLSQFATPDFAVTEKITNADKTTKTTTHHKGNFSTLGIDIRTIGSYSLTDDIFIRAQLGAIGWDNKYASLNVAEDEVVTVTEAKDRGVSLITGFGFGYGISKTMAVTLDFEKTEIADIPVKTISIGFSFKL